MVRDANRAPVHPGELLSQDILPGLGISVAKAAEELGVTRQALHRVLAGSAAVSPEMALRLGKFCGNGAGIWMRMQVVFDLWHAEKAIAPQLAAIKTRRAA